MTAFVAIAGSPWQSQTASCTAQWSPSDAECRLDYMQAISRLLFMQRLHDQALNSKSLDS